MCMCHDCLDQPVSLIPLPPLLSGCWPAGMETGTIVATMPPDVPSPTGGYGVCLNSYLLVLFEAVLHAGLSAARGCENHGTT